MKRAMLFLLTFLISLAGYPQYDSIRAGFQKQFENFRNESIWEHQAFLSVNDSLFSKFLKDSWATCSVFYREGIRKFKPLVQPVVTDSLLRMSVPAEIKPTEIKRENKSESAPQVKVKKAPETNSLGIYNASVEFYGNPQPVYVPPLPVSGGALSPEAIENYCRHALGSGDIAFMVSQLNDIRSRMGLNDWGYYKLAEQLTAGLIKEPAEGSLFLWVLLLKSGYNAKIGYSGDKAWVMVPSDREIFGVPCIETGGTTYYLLSSGKEIPGRMTIHSADYPGNGMISLAMERMPAFRGNFFTRELPSAQGMGTIELDRQLLGFLREYPMAEMAVYFQAPLSGKTAQSLDQLLLPLLHDKDDRQRTELLLRFVQQSFPYASDQQQFGGERYLFPDETFSYPASDCEDRAILFSNLIGRYTRLHCVALEYPGHVTTAVNLEGTGDFLMFRGRKYLICDPTWLNAPIGYLPGEYKKLQPAIIHF